MKCNFNSVNIGFKAAITDKEIDSFKTTQQHFSDCYIMTSLESLSHSENGRRILKNHIERDDKNPMLINCYLFTPTGLLEKYPIPTNTVVRGYEKLYEAQDNEIIRSMDISVGEYEKRYKAKPWICRFTDDFKTYTFENGIPSHFMEILTGREPTVNIAEMDFNIDLTSRKDEVMELFKRMSKNKEHSLVIGTGIKMLDGRTWHVYVLEDVDLNNNTITVKNKRGNITKTMNIDTALNTFKFIVGYFNEDLKPKFQ